MNDLHGDAAVRGGESEDMGLNALECCLRAILPGGRGQENPRVEALEDRLTRRMEALEALEAKLTHGLDCRARNGGEAEEGVEHAGGRTPGGREIDAATKGDSSARNWPLTC